MFDRADYAPRDRLIMRAPSSALGSVVAEDSAPALPPIPAPALDEHTMTVAFLHTLGHSEADIARLMAGPPKKSA